jgi:chromosome partitioning protein
LDSNNKSFGLKQQEFWTAVHKATHRKRELSTHGKILEAEIYLTSAAGCCYFPHRNISTNEDNYTLMKTIIVTSQKGGSGKTTIAVHLAVEAERAGDGPARLIDTDPQGTLTSWHQRRPVETPVRLDVPPNVPPIRLRAGLDKLATEGTGFCFIDTAPVLSEANKALLQLADLVLIPVRPSAADLWSVTRTIEQAKEIGKPFLFVMSQAKPQTRITAQAVAVLSAHGRVAQAFIADRVAYAAALTAGHTAPEIAAKSAAAGEIAALWTEVKACFAENDTLLNRRLSNG